MYTEVWKRHPVSCSGEIGIMKPIGAPKLYIVNVILRETYWAALGGLSWESCSALDARAGIK